MGGNPRLLKFSMLAALLMLSATVQGDDEKDLGEFSAFVKITDWDTTTNMGVFKVGKRHILFKIKDTSFIRKDIAVRAADRERLESFKDKTVWCFSTKTRYKRRKARADGALKPRLLIAMGDGIEPLPSGRRSVKGVVGLFDWYKAEVTEWLLPGEATVEGAPYHLGLGSREWILRGTKASSAELKKNLKVHIEGLQVTDRAKIYRTGKLAIKVPESKKKLLIEAPVLEVTRLVIPHKAFKKFYGFMFKETYRK